jgi:hypothetical protein
VHGRALTLALSRAERELVVSRRSALPLSRGARARPNTFAGKVSPGGAASSDLTRPVPEQI